MPVVGVSLGLPDPWAEHIQDKRRSYGDPLADAIHTHITLVPPTEVATADLPQLRDHLHEVGRGRLPFRIRLEGTDTFRPVSPVVFLRVVEGTTECAELSAAIRTGPFERDLEFDYHPHVTIAHHLTDESLDAAAADMADFAVTFPVEAFQLYEQDHTGRWHLLGDFPLG